MSIFLVIRNDRVVKYFHKCSIICDIICDLMLTVAWGRPVNVGSGAILVPQHNYIFIFFF